MKCFLIPVRSTVSSKLIRQIKGTCPTYDSKVLEYALCNQCMFCNRRFKGGLDLRLGVYGHKKCIDKHTISKSELQKDPLYINIGEIFPYNKMINSEHTALLPEKTWIGLKKSRNYLMAYFEYRVLIELRQTHFQKSFMIYSQ